MTIPAAIPPFTDLRKGLQRVSGVSSSAAERILEAGLPYALAHADGGSLRARHAWAHQAIRFAIAGLPARVALDLLGTVAREMPKDGDARVPNIRPTRSERNAPCPTPPRPTT